MVFSITRGALGLTGNIIELKILGLCTWVTGKVTEMVFHHPVKSDLEGMGVSLNCPLFCHVSSLGRGSHKQRGHSWLNLSSDDLSKTLKGEEQHGTFAFS